MTYKNSKDGIDKLLTAKETQAGDCFKSPDFALGNLLVCTLRNFTHETQLQTHP